LLFSNNNYIIVAIKPLTIWREFWVRERERIRPNQKRREKRKSRVRYWGETVRDREEVKVSQKGRTLESFFL